ncbi:MAG: type II toxin-antitoxin system VapC family toxin [Akkermansiaceae bacterium]
MAASARPESLKKRYLLDTSALLAHLLQESGCEVVERLLETSGAKLAVCILTWVEFEIFLNRSTYRAKEKTRILSIYRAALGDPLPVDEKVGREALLIREALGTRIPLTDLLIAACAKANGFVLVYRDKYLTSIPEDVLEQLRLPSKEARTRQAK